MALATQPARACRATHGHAADGSPLVGDAPDAELLAQIRRIEIRARRLASTLLAGDYRSVFHGAGIEFAEAREYTPGDDVRRIDWNVTARLGTPWVKAVRRGARTARRLRGGRLRLAARRARRPAAAPPPPPS